MPVAEVAKPMRDETMIEVHCAKDVWYGPTPMLHKLYKGPCQEFPNGEKLTIPMWRFTDFDTPIEIKTPRGVMSFRGSFIRADKIRPVEDNIAKHGEDVAFLLAQNEELKRRLAEKEAGPVPTVVVEPEKRGPGRPRKDSEAI
jgi:hypothetical protein